MNLSRRQSLGLLAGAVIPPTVVVGAAPIVAAATKMTAKERYDHHLAEFKKAAQELDPMISSWHVSAPDADDPGKAFAVTANRVTGRYDGDGRYECARANWDGRRVIYDVQLMNYIWDDERVFSVRTAMDRRLLIESTFETFIGRKVGGVL